MEAQPDRRWIILAVFAALAIVVVGAILLTRDDGDGGGDTTSAGGSESGGCEKVEAPAPKNASFSAPDEVLDQGEEASVVIETSCGAFTIELDTERAPKTANSFAFLAEEGFYDGVTFHRVVPGFVIQGGDPEGTGSGGPGYSVDEEPPAGIEYTKGLVAMAKSEAEPPGRSGSQFYVVTAPDAGLPPEYAIVGEVSEGFDTVERIEKQGEGDGPPKQTILLESATLERE